MPQLDFSSFSSQAFWIVVSFLLMWMFMANFIVPKITDIMNQRQRKIDDYLSAAEQFKISAEAALSKYEKALEKANSEAEETLREAEMKINKKIEEHEIKQEIKLSEFIEKNRLEIEEQRRVTLQQIEKISTDLAMQITQKTGLNGIIDKADIESITKQG